MAARAVGDTGTAARIQGLEVTTVAGIASSTVGACFAIGLAGVARPRADQIGTGTHAVQLVLSGPSQLRQAAWQGEQL